MPILNKQPILLYKYIKFKLTVVFSVIIYIESSKFSWMLLKYMQCMLF